MTLRASDCRKKSSSEYPMYPECTNLTINQAFEKSTKKAAEITYTFFLEVASAQKKFIDSLNELLKDSDLKKQQ